MFASIISKNERSFDDSESIIVGINNKNVLGQKI